MSENDDKNRSLPNSYPRGEWIVFPADKLKKVEEIIARYPDGKSKSAILPILHIAQDHCNGWLSADAMDYVAGLLKELELPFRTLKLCGGDMSFASALTYDMEVWSAAQERWLEVSSVSNFETFQSNKVG